ncbi:MAG: trigger factor family protein, partial [Erysipelotrichaceae bacterium]|nr:trigger factor family protein [Erysipelotrichaceae bacterium]
MKSTWSIVEKSNGELLVTVDGEQWKTAQEKAFKKLAGKLNVKGFRQGKAPVNIARKMIGQNEIMMNAIDAVAQEALVFGVEEQGLELIDRPSLDLNSFTTEAVELKFLCTVEPEVTLGTYKGVEYDEIKVRVNAGEVKDRLEQIRNNAAEMVLKEEGTVEKGDTANID